ncbi:MAG: Ppx/GppA family phosphatase [Actinomycetota bacterium]|nr:Ppx/GppA family phosphatase [Actinomycetota bacterium]
MRLGVLDVGSNTVHLLVVDARRGGHPLPAHSEKSVLRLTEHVNAKGKLSTAGAEALVGAVESARKSAKRLGVDDLMAFATSAVRDASNSDDVIEQVRAETGVDIDLLTGEDEARLTFLAVRRWYGWSAGRLLVLDIGGGSLEVAAGIDEVPDVAMSVPLGAGRLTREWLPGDPPDADTVDKLRAHVEKSLQPVVDALAEVDRADRVVATSKTFRSLARLTGAAPSSAGQRVPRQLTLAGLRQVVAFICRITAADLAGLDGVSAARAHQLLAGGVVAEAAMRMLNADSVDLCPWALREGVILRRLDWLDGA